MCSAIKRTPSVAVVAVHGISDHAPGETARLVADSLLTYGDFREADVTYETAREVQLRIPVQEVKAPRLRNLASAAPEIVPDPPSRFEERSAFIMKMHERKPERGDNDSTARECASQVQVSDSRVTIADGKLFELGRAERPIGDNASKQSMEETLHAQASGRNESVSARTGFPGYEMSASRLSDSISDNLAHGFMLEQLESYQCVGADTVYETVRIETARMDEAAKTRTDVDIYEVHWSDLLRPKLGVWRIFAELYQTLFHLSHIGRQTIDYAFAEHAEDTHGRLWWSAFSTTHRWAVRILTLAVPILNLFLLALLLLIPLSALSHLQIVVLVRLIPVVALVSAAGFLLLRSGKEGYLLWLVTPLFLSIALLLAIEVISSDVGNLHFHVGEYRWLAIEACSLAAIPIGVAVNYYERRRPGARFFALMIAPYVTISLIVSISQAPNSEYGYIYSLLHVIEVLFLAVVLAWTFLLICNCILLIPGAILGLNRSSQANRDSGELSRSRRAIATAFLSLSLPSALFLLVTLVLYSALVKVVVSGLSASSVYPPTPVLTDFFEVPDALHPGDMFDRLIDHSSTPTFLFFLYWLVLAVLLSIWGLFPLIWMDLRPRREQGRQSELSGEWLNRGYRALQVAAVFVFLAAPITLTVGIIAGWTGWLGGDWLGQSHIRRIWAGVGALVMGSAIGLLAFHGRLQKLALGFRPLLNAILDIDNYLREFPRDAAPRARVCARYASLLRYICQRRDEQDRAYNAIVIVAHSQGTVISADLLRFLRKETDPELTAILRGAESAIPTYLLTLGCPLRQLYGWRFPHLYGWARHELSVSPTAWKPSDLPDEVHPDPRALGVEQWVNAYGSGDYVGRHLWRSDNCAYLWSPPENGNNPGDEKPLLRKNISGDKCGSRREFCIGAAAHMQYFAEESPVVAELDRLIQVASKSQTGSSTTKATNPDEAGAEHAN